MKSFVIGMTVLILMLTACGGKETSADEEFNENGDSETAQLTDEQYFLKGELIEINEDQVLMDAEGVGLVWVTLEDGLDMAVSLKSTVQVQYNGIVAESYPGQAWGHSLEVLEPFLDNALYTYDEMTETLSDQTVYPVVVWNGVKDMVAYAAVEEGMAKECYTVYVAGMYEESAVKLAMVFGEVPDLNWFYDRLEVQTNNGTKEFGPNFYEITEPYSFGNYEPVEEVAYTLEEKTFEDEANNISIQYYQVSGMAGELVMDYVNQSLRHIVDIYGDGYSNTKIESAILRQDNYLTIAYSGHNETMDYAIDRYLTLDMATATEITVDGIIADMEKFSQIFEERSGFKLEEQEGVWVYFTVDEAVFTFVPLDDSAEREYVVFGMTELMPYLNLTFEMPAS